LRVATILENEVPPPHGGTDNCQNWVADALVALEVEEIVAEGTTEVWAGRVAGLTLDIKRNVGDAGGGWVSLNGR
jgi:hypothetical protein